MRELLNDIVTIVNSDGRIENVKASVQRKKIYLDDVSIPIEEGDLIERQLRNGRTEVMHVTDVHLWTGMGGIPDYYEIEYERRSARSKLARPGDVTVTVLDSLQPHININSTDQSVNVVHGQPHPVFDEIRALLQEHLHDASNLDHILTSVDEMERSRNTPHEFTQAYKEFMSLAADHIAFLAPILPSLVSLL